LAVTASLTLGEQQARKLAAAAAEDSALRADAVDLHERSVGVWDVVIYLGGADDARRKAVAEIIGGLTGEPAAVEWRELVETDWVRRSQEALPAVRVGRVLVYPAHHTDQVRENDVAILIEAGQAFGTGHHATTQGCLRAIQWSLRSHPVRSALDIGTGSGVLAIAIARHAIPVVATDIDPVAVRLAQGNARMNRVAAWIDVRLTPAIPHHLHAGRQPGGYDLVVANILMEPLLALAPAIRDASAAGGVVILSGLLPHQRVPVVATYRSVGLRLKRWFVLDGWLTMVLERPGRRRRGVTKRRRSGPATATNPRPSH
jgi:ribosomal protein L11 methyltransferase